MVMKTKRCNASPEKIWKSAGEMAKEAALLLSGDVHYHLKNPLPFSEPLKLIPTQILGWSMSCTDQINLNGISNSPTKSGDFTSI